MYNVDGFVTREHVSCMDKDRKNHYVVILRDGRKSPISLNYFAELYKDGNTYRLEYEYVCQEWC